MPRERRARAVGMARHVRCGVDHAEADGAREGAPHQPPTPQDDETLDTALLSTTTQRPSPRSSTIQAGGEGPLGPSATRTYGQPAQLAMDGRCAAVVGSQAL